MPYDPTENSNLLLLLLLGRTAFSSARAGEDNMAWTASTTAARPLLCLMVGCVSAARAHYWRCLIEERTRTTRPHFFAILHTFGPKAKTPFCLISPFADNYPFCPITTVRVIYSGQYLTKKNLTIVWLWIWFEGQPLKTSDFCFVSQLMPLWKWWRQYISSSSYSLNTPTHG